MSWWEKLKSNELFIIGGPCGAEDRDQIMDTATYLSSIKEVHLMRAGLWKPRTRPGTFEGEGELGGEWLVEARDKTGIGIMTEVANAGHVQYCIENNFDAIWIGARTVGNPFSVQEIANAIKGTDIPVFVKNPIHADLNLWIGAIERFQKSGITKVAAIHRGFSSWDKSNYRYAPMWEYAIELKMHDSTIPLICDPSHISGRRDLVSDISQKALDLNYDGLMIETHPNPDHAKSDVNQQITLQDFSRLIQNLEVRNQQSNNPELISRLEQLRAIVDEIDSDIVARLKRRMSIVEHIGQEKKEHNMAIYQEERWAEIQGKLKDLCSELNLSNAMIHDLWNVIHKYSMEFQELIYSQKEEPQE